MVLKGSTSIRDRDRGMKHLRKQLAIAGRRLEVTAGVHKAEGEQPKQIPGGKSLSGVTVAEVAAIHEIFGVPEKNVPRRPFLASTFDENKGFQVDINRIFIAIVLKRLNIFKAMALLGNIMESKIRKKIRSNIPPGLKKETLRKKTVGGKVGNIALINTSQLLKAIKSEVSR